MDQPAGMSIDDKVFVAQTAWAVFAPVRDPAIEATLDLPNPGELRKNLSRGMTVHHLLVYLKKTTGKDYFPVAFHIEQLLASMERAGLLMEHPFVRAYEPAPLSRFYWSAGNVTDIQRAGDLWLSPVLGASLVIPRFGSATIAVTGTPVRGKRAIGSGLILDDRHILTAGHVVDGMEVDELLTSPGMAPGPPQVRVTDCHRSSLMDLAVLEVSPIAGKRALSPLAGVGFRNPEWGDVTYVFGYPPSQLPDSDSGPNLIVQRGEVVNPNVMDFDRRRIFLYSAIARPGASGGPIVAHDGRVIGMVIEEGLSARNSLGEELAEADRSELGSFYIGIPSSEIIRALKHLGLENLAKDDSNYGAVMTAAVSNRAIDWPGNQRQDDENRPHPEG